MPDKSRAAKRRACRSRARATRASTSAEPSAGGGRIRSAAVTAGTSIDRSMRSSSGPGHPRLILRHAAVVRLAPADIAGLRRLPAAARVHGGDKLEPRRVGDAMVGAGDQDLARLERLPQRIEHLRLEFRQLVEKQHAIMRKRCLSGPRIDAAAHQRRHGGGMVRARGTAGGSRARRWPAGPRPTGSWRFPAARAGVSGGRIDGSRCASIDLPAPGGPLIRRLWRAGGGDLERPLGALLALDVAQIRQRPPAVA